MKKSDFRCFVLFLSLILTFIFLPCLTFSQVQRVRVWSILDWSDELGLSDKQEKDIKAYLFDLERKLGKLRVEFMKVNREIRELLREGMKRGGKLDMEKVKSKIRKAYEIRAEMDIARLETAQKINGVLTPKQFEKWKKILAKELESKRKDKGGRR